MADAYTRGGQDAQAVPLLQEVLGNARGELPKDSPERAGLLAQTAMALLRQKQWAEAEPMIDERLTIREQALPDDWSTFNAKSMLGGALLGQRKYAEAEPLLLDGYRGMQARRATIPPPGGPRLLETMERLAQLYAATGNQAKASAWRSKLEAARAEQAPTGADGSKPSRLRSGDTIRIGAFQLVFRLGGTQDIDPSASTFTAGQTLVAMNSSACWLLLADIEDSSALSQRLDPESLAVLIGRWLARCKEVIEGEAGTINKYLGDGLFAYWPATPLTPARLVQALGALRRLQAEAEPRFRLVLHHGQVVMGGRASMGEESLSGTEVNFIFRMEKLAAAIRQTRLLSKAAAQQLGASLTPTPVGQHALPGFAGEHAFLSF